MPKRFFHADQIGSLLHPERLIEARGQFERGEISRERLTEIEDDCIRQVAKKQEENGLESICDGKFRRSVWWFEFINSVNGIKIVDPDPNLTFKGDNGDNAWDCAPKNVLTVGKLSRPENIMERDFKVHEDRQNHDTLARTHPFPRRTGRHRQGSGDHAQS